MQHIYMSLFDALLFSVLTPGFIIVLPHNPTNFYIVAAVHVVIFAVIYHFTKKIVWNTLYSIKKLKFKKFIHIYNYIYE